MRNFLSVFLIFFLVVPFFGQEFDSQKDEEEFAKVCEAISSKKITKGDFRQLKFIQRLKREMASTGIFVISADDGILWQTQKPYFSTMAMTKSAIIQTNAKGKKIRNFGGIQRDFRPVFKSSFICFYGKCRYTHPEF